MTARRSRLSGSIFVGWLLVGSLLAACSAEVPEAAEEEVKRLPTNRSVTKWRCSDNLGTAFLLSFDYGRPTQSPPGTSARTFVFTESGDYATETNAAFRETGALPPTGRLILVTVTVHVAIDPSSIALEYFSKPTLLPQKSVAIQKSKIDLENGVKTVTAWEVVSRDSFEVQIGDTGNPWTCVRALTV